MRWSLKHSMIKKKNVIQRLTMPLPELEHYYRERRKERFENNEPFGGVKLRKLLHPVLVGGMKMLHLLGRQKITVLTDRRIPTARPIVYAATHIGWEDIEMLLSTIGDHAYLFWGDAKGSYKTMDGFLLDLNGIIVCETGDKMDRYIGKETCVKWLAQGGNLLIFPEGAWNVTESLPVMPLFNGAAEMAIRSGTEIIPVAIERYGQNYTINIGQNIPVTNLELAQKHQLTETLRDAIASLKWEIWESQPHIKQSDIPSDYRLRELQELQQQQEQMHGVYTVQDIEITRFHTKAETAQKEVKDHLSKLIPCRENAFLLRQDRWIRT